MSELNDPQDGQPEQSNQIGAFSGYNRRPAPAQSGMNAQFYGEDGEDADMMSALSLTKYQETDVWITVYWVKDAAGSLMKTHQGYPVISSFKARIQRPKPQRDGMLAQFFAENGPHADSVIQLGLTKYLDSFVYVEILKTPPNQSSDSVDALLAVAASAEQPDVHNEIEQISRHLTPAERKAVDRKNKLYKEANKALMMSGFLSQPSIWSLLGNELDFEAWVGTFSCCAPGAAPCKNQATPFKLPNESHPYSYVPLCPEHQASALSGALPGGAPLLKMRRQVLAQEWAWDRLRALVGVDEGFDEPDPQKIMLWAFERKVSQHIPPNYLAKII